MTIKTDDPLFPAVQNYIAKGQWNDDKAQTQVTSGGDVDNMVVDDTIKLEESKLIFIESLFKEEKDNEKVAQIILEGILRDVDILYKDTLDRFLDFVIFKVKTGVYYIPNLAYPTKKIADAEFEDRIIQLINFHLYPDIIFRLLKYFTRNVKDPDSNLYLANLITSEDIIKAIFNTFLMFKKDIFETDQSKRYINVKRIQQFPHTSDSRSSSPLDAACRFKYILEFIALKQSVEQVYTLDDLSLSRR